MLRIARSHLSLHLSKSTSPQQSTSSTESLESDCATPPKPLNDVPPEQAASENQLTNAKGDKNDEVSSPIIQPVESQEPQEAVADEVGCFFTPSRQTCPVNGPCSCSSQVHRPKKDQVRQTD
ncbi:hypothetical protein TSMEX_006984 [Taenia solium]|eukprot:TsM_001088800 transcript=TsM_001088800 gene=TsM_001088800